MKRRLSTICAVLAILAASGTAYADDDVTSLSYISYLERYATLHPGRGSETLDAVVNMPVLAGDQLDTSRGARVEVQLAEGATLWVDEFTNVSFDAIANSRDSASPRTALYLADGTVAVEIPATTSGEGIIRVDSPDGTVNLNRPGLYRLDMQSGQLHVAAFLGLAELPAGMGSSPLRTGQEATVGSDGQVETAALSGSTDDFWNWVQERRQPAPSTRTAEVVEGNVGEHAAVLDSYGDWVWVGDFDTWMWRPRVAPGWTPYCYGRWYWTPVGWDWISYEPWGWCPFHYGSWYFDASFGWVWGWDRVWGPAWVHWIYTPGYVGWSPRGYYDWWYAHNCTHCWGEGWRRPPRWGDVAFDFNGRARFDGLDSRPWTIVSTGDFRNTHLDRLRLDSEQVRERLGDREGIVRSGQMVTPPPSRMTTGQDLEAFFRSEHPGAPRTDLSEVLRRAPDSGARTALPIADMRPMRTTDLMASTRVPVPEARSIAHFRAGTGAIDRGSGSDRWQRQGTRTGAPTTGGSGGSPTPPVVGRELVVPRTQQVHGGSGGTSTPPSREHVSRTVHSGESSGSSGHSGASAQPRPRQSASWMSPYGQRSEWGADGYASRGVPYRAAQAPWAGTYSAPRTTTPSQAYRPPTVARSYSAPSSGHAGHASGGSSSHASHSSGGRSGRH